jgi:hypothetical protein
MTREQDMVIRSAKGSITVAFWMCCLDVRLTVECVFNVIFEFLTLKITSKTHSTVKGKVKLHIQNASVIDPLVIDSLIQYPYLLVMIVKFFGFEKFDVLLAHWAVGSQLLLRVLLFEVVGYLPRVVTRVLAERTRKPGENYSPIRSNYLASVSTNV